MGMREESDEAFIATEEGMMKTKSIRGRAGTESWNKQLFNNIKGTPWEPIPGRQTVGVSVSVRIPKEVKKSLRRR